MVEVPSQKKNAQMPALFVGRVGLLEEMSTAMDDVEKRLGSCFLLSGEAGVGKTSLSNKVQELARARNWTVMASDCVFTEGGTPYQPLVRAIFNFQTSGTAGKSTDAKLSLPVGLVGLDDPGSDTRTTDEIKVKRESMFETIADFLTDASRKSPILLVLDDMHRADNSTCQMLYYLVRSMADQRMLFIGTYRSEEVETSKTIHPLVDMRTRLQREGLVTLRDIKRFSEQETANFLIALMGYELPERLVKKIHNDTSGNPYFITEFMGTLKETGMFQSKGKEQTAPEIGDEDLKIPSSVSAFIEDKVEHLSPDELKMLQFGSLIGQEFSYDLLVDVSGLPEEKVVSYLEALMAQKLVSEVMVGDKISYKFTHNLIKDVVYAHMSRSKRRLMHKMVGNSIEKVEAKNLDPMVYLLAYHFTLGGDAPKALRYNVLAGKKATNSFALDEAKRYYEEALDILWKQDETEVTMAMEIDLLNRLGFITGVQGDNKKAMNYHQEALVLTKDGTKEWAATIRKLAEAEILLDQWKAAEGHLMKAINVSEKLDDQLGLSDAYYNLEHIAFKTGKPNEVLKYADKVIEYATKVKDERLIGKCLIDKANTLSELKCDHRTALSLYMESMKHFDQEKDLDQIARVYCNIGDLYEKLGEFKKGIDYLEKCLMICDKTGDMDQKAYALSNLGQVYMDMDDRKNAIKYLNDALKVLDRLENKHILAMTRLDLAIIARRERDFDTAERELQMAFKSIEDVDFKIGLAHLNLEYGHLWRDKGNKENARAYFLKAIGLVEEIGSDDRIQQYKKELSTLDGKD